MNSLRIQAKELKHPVLKPLEINLQDGLSPDEAAIIAVLANPALRAVRDKKGLAIAQLFLAGVLPNPTLAYSLNIPTGGNTQGTVNAYGFTLEWDIIKSLITRGAEIDAARAHAASVDLDIAWQEWQVAQKAKLDVYHLFFLEKQLAVAQNEEKGLYDKLRAIEKAVDMRDMTIIELHAAKEAVQTAHMSVLVLEQQMNEVRMALNKAMGFPPEVPIPLRKNIEPPSLKKLPAVAGIMDGIENRRLDLLALKMGYESQEATLRAAILGQFPKIIIGALQARDNTNVKSTGFSINISLPFFDRNQGHIAVEQATRKQLFDEYVNRVFETRAELAQLLRGIASVEKQIKAAEEAITTSRNLVETSYRGLLEGNIDILSYYNEQNKLISSQIEILKSKQNLADLYVSLEIASGQYLANMETMEEFKQ